MGKQYVKFAKQFFGTTSCKIMIRHDHLQNLQQILVVKNCPKKFATKPRLTKRFTKKRMQITWFTWSSLNKLITYTVQLPFSL